MLSNIKNVYYLILFVAIFFHINNFAGSQSLVYSQEISPNENLKHISSNYSVPADGLSRSDRLYHEMEPPESKFFIKSNTIIRTGESRALGAKYLNETRLPSNHECLTWCLETPTCNVAVYDEKNMHSCYMFDCGSPEKPLCKFTSHNFFTSSILKMSQHSYELSQWGRQVLQGKEKVERHPDIKLTTPVSVDTKTLLSSTVSSPANVQPIKKGSVCHHYQFQCINSSECIAIYNVCDGIPQCPDGSDESSELKCPDKDAPKEVKQSNNLNRVSEVSPQLDSKPPATKQELPTPHSSAPFVGVQSMQHKKLPLEHKETPNKDYKSSWPNSYSETSLSQNPYYHHVEDSDKLASPFIHKHSQFISANDPHVQNLNHWANDYDQYPPHSTSLEQQYNPYEHVDEQYLANQMSQDYDNGKSFGGYRPDDISYWPSQDVLQDNSYTVDEFPQPGVQNLNKVIGYPEKENAYAQQIARTAEQYPEAKLNLRKQLLTPNQASDMDEYKLRRYSHSRQQQQQQQQPYLGLEDTLQQRFPNYPEMKSKGYIPMQNVEDTKYNNDDLIRASLVNQLPKKIDQVHHPQEHAMKQFEMIHHPQKENIAKGTEAPKDNSLIVVKPTSHIKTIQRTVLDFKMSVAELYQSSTTHTHEANSAILALVVGVTVSILLVILLACRMKTLRRRMSRKGRSLAHDADYLVNGMYL